MLPVSTDYPAAIRKRRDRIIRSRVEITWTDPQTDQSIQVTSNDQANISWLNHVADGREESSFKYLATDGSCVSDGTYYTCPDTPELAFYYQMGWWSGKVSDQNGEFSPPYPRITIRMAPQTILGLRIVGDSKRGEWPVDFDVYLYQGSQLAHVEQVTGNDKVIFEKSLYEYNLYDISRMVIEVKKISHPRRHAKIVEAFTSMKEIYEGRDIAYLSVLEERETSIDGSLPIGHMTSNELVVQLINLRDRFNPGNIFSAYHNLLKLNRKVRAWIGPKLLGRDVVEYKPMGTFWVKSIDVAEDSYYVTFTCQDMLQLLSDTEYNCPTVHNANLYDQAVAVLEDARTVLGLPNEEFYWVDPELQDIVIEWFFLETMSHREALRRIVERALGQGYVSRKNIIRVEGVNFIKLPEGS